VARLDRIYMNLQVFRHSHQERPAYMSFRKIQLIGGDRRPYQNDVHGLPLCPSRHDMDEVQRVLMPALPLATSRTPL